MTWLLVIAGVIANAAASVLVKMSSAGSVDLRNPLTILQEWRLILAVACYGFAFVAYAAAVMRLPLNIAHPIATAGAIVLVGLASAFMFKEAFTPAHLVGYGLLLAGIVALAFARGGAA
jgi:multidrug transporter EmrE-like cation transporter